MADDNQQPPPRGLLAQTASVAGQVVEKTGIKRWGIGEWGSIASFIGIGLWVYDQVRRENAAQRPVQLANGRIAYGGRVYAVAEPFAEESDESER